MTDTPTTVNCPECGTEVNVTEIVMKNAERNLRREYEAKLEAERSKIKEQQAQLASKAADLASQEKGLEKQVQEALGKQLLEERSKLTLEIKEKVEKEQEEANKILHDELEKKSSQIKELNNTKAELKKLQLEKDELATSIEAKMQERLNETLKTKTAEITEKESIKNEKRLAEQTEMVNQLKKQLIESQRKIEQGSMQIQGETQEVAIENFLKETYPLDEIEEIKKGAKGGDCLQIINTRENINCGSIYYESKRVKTFNLDWVNKLKQDMIEKGANIGVIITETMPDNLTRAGQINGIWVCTLQELKGLSNILREALIMINHTIKSHENKDDKMNLLYNYLTGSEFALQVESIVDGFTQMKTDLESEKRAMTRIWKTREKQIEKVTLNTTGMYGSLKGIIGNRLSNIKTLELPNSEALEQ